MRERKTAQIILTSDAFAKASHVIQFLPVFSVLG